MFILSGIASLSLYMYTPSYATDYGLRRIVPAVRIPGLRIAIDVGLIWNCPGLTTAIKDLIDNGPPEGFLTRFLQVFGEKATQTERAVQVAMPELGWHEDATASGS